MSLVIGKEPTYERLVFYKGEIVLMYDDDAHVYYRESGRELVPQDNVTTALKIIDKSEMLVPWGCRVMGEKLLGNLPIFTTKDGRQMVSSMPYEVALTLIMDAKSAHKERLDDAANVGKAAHYWIEQYIKLELGRITQLPPLPEEPRAANCCNAALDWMKAHSVRWLQTERKVYSRKYSYTGTADGLCYCDSCNDRTCCKNEFKDRLSLVDWKSSNQLQDTYFLQTAAYQYAMQEEFLMAIEDRWLNRLGKEDGKFESRHVEIQDFDRDFETFLVTLELVRSMKDIKARTRAASDEIKEKERAVKRAEKDAAKRAACPKSASYKGSKLSKCLEDGTQCAACAEIYAKRQC